MPGGTPSGSTIGSVAGTGGGYTPTTTTGGTGAPTTIPKSSSGFDVVNGQLDLTKMADYQFNVWTGDYTTRVSGPNPEAHYGNMPGGPQTTQTPAPINAGLYLEQLMAQPPGATELLQNQLVAAGRLRSGGFQPGTWDAVTRSAVLGLMQDTSLADGAGGNLTVMGLLSQEVAKRQAAGKGEVQTTSITHLTDPDAAKHLLTQALGQYLGVMPNDAMVAQFTAQLQAAERANPQLTQSNVEPGQIDPTTGLPTVKSQVVQEGLGTDPYRTGQTQMAEDFARAQPGSTEFQATQYLAAVWSALTSPGGHA